MEPVTMTTESEVQTPATSSSEHDLFREIHRASLELAIDEISRRLSSTAKRDDVLRFIKEELLSDIVTSE